jgi:hypothetical protein
MLAINILTSLAGFSIVGVHPPLLLVHLLTLKPLRLKQINLMINMMNILCVPVLGFHGKYLHLNPSIRLDLAKFYRKYVVWILDFD